MNNKGNKINKNIVVIFDEVDGMSSGDRGGNAQLSNFIDATAFPMICICNDSKSQKMRNMKSKCVDLAFHKPTKMQIVNKLMNICKLENLRAEKNALEKLVEITNNDIRSSITTLEIISHSKKDITMDTIINAKPGKDVNVMMNFFDAISIFLTPQFKNYSFREKLDFYFID